jgi:hypothetical protein
LPEGRSDEFIQGVVATDVFAESQDISLPVEKGGGVEAACRVEDILLLPEEGGQGIEQVCVEGWSFVCPDGWADGAEGVDGRFATDAATGAGIEMALQPSKVEEEIFPDGNTDDITRLLDVCRVGGKPLFFGEEVGGAVDDPFGEQETDGQIGIMAGGSHGDRDALFLTGAGGAEEEADLQRFFYGDIILCCGGKVGPYFLDWQAGHSDRVGEISHRSKLKKMTI